MEQLRDSHYFRLPSQGNIYTIASLQVANSPCKVLVASLNRDIFCLDYQESPGGLIPTTKAVSFTYIPSGAEIISIDAFNKSETKNEFVIGITIIKNNNNLDSLEFYLNIYSEWEESQDFNIENIAQNCLTVELSFTPYQLTHTDLVVWKNEEVSRKEVVFLLSGNDNQVHVYREHTTDHLYKEVDGRDYFPEFIKTPSPVVWMDIHYNKDCTERFTVIACECGYVRFTKVCVKTKKLAFNFSTKFDNYVSNVQIYPESDKILNLVVINTVLPSVLFTDVTTYGLSNYCSLPRHDYTSVLTCCQVVDIDFDGEMEILIGNSAEEVMMYKRDASKGWCLEELKLFASPVMNLKYIDVLGDGVKELVVLSMKGVHFLQYDFDFIEKVLMEKVGKLEMPDIAALKL